MDLYDLALDSNRSSRGNGTFGRCHGSAFAVDRLAAR